MVFMAKRQIMPVAIEYSKSLCDSIIAKSQIGVSAHAERNIVNKLSELINDFDEAIESLENKIENVGPQLNIETAAYFKDNVIPCMKSLRIIADELESILPEKLWPFPTYADLLFNL